MNETTSIAVNTFDEDFIVFLTVGRLCYLGFFQSKTAAETITVTAIAPNTMSTSGDGGGDVG